MDQQQQSRWRPTRRQLLWAGGVAALAFLLTVICGYLFGWKWTGLPKKTLWDWLQLLIIPAVLAGVGLWFNRQQREQELQTADRRAQDEALQAYLDQMSAMLIPNKDHPSLYDEHPPDSLRTVARARTLTVLSRLDGDRKAQAVQFLQESLLIYGKRPVVELHRADLSGANLFTVGLSGANLMGTDLSGANLKGAVLEGAVLSATILMGANLEDADLEGANLEGAVLEGATGWTAEQLETARNLEEAVMPDGQRLRGEVNPDGPTFEDWLKSKGREEDAENE